MQVSLTMGTELENPWKTSSVSLSEPDGGVVKYLKYERKDG